MVSYSLAEDLLDISSDPRSKPSEQTEQRGIIPASTETIHRHISRVVNIRWVYRQQVMSAICHESRERRLCTKHTFTVNFFRPFFVGGVRIVVCQKQLFMICDVYIAFVVDDAC